MISLWVSGGLVVFVIGQLMAAIWWASKITAKQDAHNQRISKIEDQRISERLVVLENDLQHLLTAVNEIKTVMIDVKTWVNQQIGRESKEDDKKD